MTSLTGDHYVDTEGLTRLQISEELERCLEQACPVALTLAFPTHNRERLPRFQC